MKQIEIVISASADDDEKIIEALFRTGEPAKAIVEMLGQLGLTDAKQVRRQVEQTEPVKRGRKPRDAAVDQPTPTTTLGELLGDPAPELDPTPEPVATETPAELAAAQHVHRRKTAA